MEEQEKLEQQFCPNCNSEMELDEGTETYICPECGTEVQPEIDWEAKEGEEDEEEK